MTETKEPISDASPMLYTSREEGVVRQFDVRADKFDDLMNLTKKASDDHREKREQRIQKKNTDKNTNDQTVQNKNTDTDNNSQNLKAV